MGKWDKYKKNKNKENVEQKDTNKGLPATCINWYPGHMAKTKREIRENINLIDIAYEVIDARMPISSKIVDIDNLLKDKKKLLIVTKYDMCDKERTDIILKKYQEEGYNVIPVDLITGKNVKTIITETLKIQKEMNEVRKSKGMKERRIRALVVGVPNAGKSTLINRLVGKKVSNVGDKPGVTKNLGWIRIHENIELLDSPGILWPKLENQQHALNLASLSSIKEEILRLDEITMHILKKLNERYPKLLEERYGITEIDFDDIVPTLDIIAKKRGALSKGGVPNYEKVYQIVVRDLKEGLIGKVTFD